MNVRACNSTYITVEWNQPNSYGEAKIIAYRVYVDAKVEAVLSSDQTTFTLSKGEPCHEYTFQVQAICNLEKYSGLVSSPVVAIWPGLVAPGFREIDNKNGMVRVAWDDPIIAGSTKISYFRVIASSMIHTNDTSVHGPFENNIRECEIHNMTLGKHKLVLQVYACGISEPFCSKPLFVEFLYYPEAPTLMVHVPGLEQRTRLDNIAASLCNKRDRMLKIVTNSPLTKNSGQNSKSLVPKAMSSLRILDEALNDCLKILSHFTGYFIVNLSWCCEQPNPMVRLSGYRVYINDKQYGMDLSSSVRTIRIKVNNYFLYPVFKFVN